MSCTFSSTLGDPASSHLWVRVPKDRAYVLCECSLLVPIAPGYLHTLLERFSLVRYRYPLVPEVCSLPRVYTSLCILIQHAICTYRQWCTINQCRREDSMHGSRKYLQRTVDDRCFRSLRPINKTLYSSIFVLFGYAYPGTYFHAHEDFALCTRSVRVSAL
jgi:hypothetical protein